MLHTDLIFNPKFLDNIIKSKKKYNWYKNGRKKSI